MQKGGNGGSPSMTSSVDKARRTSNGEGAFSRTSASGSSQRGKARSSRSEVAMTRRSEKRAASAASTARPPTVRASTETARPRISSLAAVWTTSSDGWSRRSNSRTSPAPSSKSTRSQARRTGRHSTRASTRSSAGCGGTLKGWGMAGGSVDGREMKRPAERRARVRRCVDRQVASARTGARLVGGPAPAIGKGAGEGHGCACVDEGAESVNHALPRLRARLRLRS